MRLILVIVLMQLAMIFIGGWALMMAFGILHHEVFPPGEFPTISFMWACVLASMIRLALFTYSGDNS